MRYMTKSQFSAMHVVGATFLTQAFVYAFLSKWRPAGVSFGLLCVTVAADLTFRRVRGYQR